MDRIHPCVAQMVQTAQKRLDAEKEKMSIIEAWDLHKQAGEDDVLVAALIRKEIYPRPEFSIAEMLLDAKRAS